MSHAGRTHSIWAADDVESGGLHTLPSCLRNHLQRTNPSAPSGGNWSFYGLLQNGFIRRSGRNSWVQRRIGFQNLGDYLL